MPHSTPRTASASASSHHARLGLRTGSRLCLGLWVCFGLSACPKAQDTASSQSAEPRATSQAIAASANAPATQATAVPQANAMPQATEMTDLFSASLTGNAAAVRRLLDEGKNPKDTDYTGQGYTVLMFAALGGNLEVVNMLMDKGADLSKSVEGYTALMFAAAGGNPDIVKLLVAKGADLNATTRDGITVLMMAFAKDTFGLGDFSEYLPNKPVNPDVVKWLLDHGANAQARTLGKEDPLRTRYWETPVSETQAVTALDYAAHGGNLAAFNMLMAKGASLRDNNVDLLLALCVASRSGTPELAQALVDLRAELNKPYGEGLSLLSMAANGDMVKYLISKGVTAEKDKALILNAPFGDMHLDVIRALLDAGANPNASLKLDRNENSTPLNDAAFVKGTSNDETIKLLLEHGAKPTVDHLGACSYNLDLIKRMIAKGADPKAKSMNGQTLIEIAREQNNKELIQYLQTLP